MAHARTLYLLRHAKSSWDDAGLSDHDRPLAPRGQRAVKKLAAHVREAGIAPELILCSTAARTRATIDPLRKALGDPEIRHLPELYAAWDDALLDIVRHVEPEPRSLLLVGHNPGLQSLAVLLAGSGDGELRLRLEEKLPTGALVTLTFRADSWAAVGPGSGRLTGYVVPRELP
jgi:phosphohistidine phosphatase